MPIAKVQLEDGRIARFEIPEGTTQGQVMEFVNQNRSMFDAPRSATAEAPQQKSPLQRREEIVKELQIVQPTGDMSRIQPLVDELSAIDEMRRSTRAATMLPEVGSELGISKLLPDIDLKTQGLISAALLSATDPNEAAQILKNASPDIGISQDEGGNLIVANNRLGLQGIINRPGLSGVDVAQTVARGAAFMPSGALSTGAKMVAGGLATEAGLQALESRAGGSFDPAALVTEAATSIFGLGIGRALRQATPKDIQKGLVREELIKRLESGDASKELLGKKVVAGKVYDAPFFSAVNKAKRQGFDERVLRSIETGNTETRKVQRDMVKVLKKRIEDADFAAQYRTTDPMGASVFKRYKAMDELKKDAGKRLDNVVKNKLKNVDVNIADDVSDFYNKLDDLGVRFTDDAPTPVINDLNPTGGVFVDYTPKQRAASVFGENMTTLSKTMGVDSDEMIEIYRGVPRDYKGGISPGDFITTSKQLAGDYGDKVISKKVKASQILDDVTEPLGEEYLYVPGAKFKSDIKSAANIDVSMIDDVNKSAAKKVLNDVVPRLKSDMTALQAHKLKKLIDSAVDYGKLPTADTALPKQLDSALKKLRSSLNERIATKSKDYAKANADYAKVIGPLGDMDKIFKSMLNLSNDEAVEAGVGTKAARTLMSNNVTRGKMLDLLKQTDDVLKVNNKGFNDDLIKQAVFVDELERMFGSEASASFTGASKRATEQAMLESAGSAMGVPLDLIRSGIDAAKGVNRDNAIKAIQGMLK